jgi:para-nitrobenzyl esterase
MGILTRRTLLGSAAGISAVLNVPFLGGGLLGRVHAEEVPGPVAETHLGKVRGLSRKGALTFRGIRYGADPSGQGRFLPAQEPAAWTGIKDAFEFGPRAVQPASSEPEPEWRQWIRDTSEMGEDCLVLNVFTPEVGQGNRPVMVYIHGGGFYAGSSSPVGVDGSNLARLGDVVVVTLNHRLGPLGFTSLAALDGKYADSGNVGMLDVVSALRWVKKNIAAFGGNPDNVTIFGQSGGASKVAALMTMLPAQGLFHRAIIQSGSSLLRMVTPEEAAKGTDGLLKKLGISPSNLTALTNVPASELVKAWRSYVSAPGGGDFARPVVDGRSMLVHPFDPKAADLMKDTPLLIGTCETELTFALGNNPKNFSLSADETRQRIQKFIKISEQDAATLYQQYEQNHPTESPSELMFRITSDQMYRRNDIIAAERKAAAGVPPYMYLFTWKTAALDGKLKSPHTMCIPLVFGNVADAAALLGAGADADNLSRKVMASWVAFARTGNPNNSLIPDWQPYSAERRMTMLFDNECKLTSDPAAKDRAALDRFPLYAADGSSRLY